MTHLCCIPLGSIVNLVTMQLPNDNQAQPFYYDRQVPPFTLPNGYALVITDVLVNPQVTSFAANQFFLVEITIDGGRSIEVRCDGRTCHFPLTTGVVAPKPNNPTSLVARNTTYSSGPVEVQVLGYVVKPEVGLGIGQAVS